MPTRSFPKKKYKSKKRTAAPRTRTNKNGNSSRTVARTLPGAQRGYLPFGRTYYARLPYVENSYIAATTLSAVGYTYSANSVYDPRYQLGGSQPFQYDLLSTAYGRVWVHGAAVTLTFTNPTEDGMYCGYRVRGSGNLTTTAGHNIDYIQEMRDSHLSPINNSGKQTKTFKFYVNNPRVFGITKAQYANLEYSHTTVGNPVAHVWIEPFAISTFTSSGAIIRYNMKITYYCQFTDSLTQPQS